MRQRDEIELLPRAANAKTAADHLVEFADLHELRDGQFPDGNDEARLQDFDFTFQPGRAVCDFLRIWNPIASARRFTRKTATDGCKINLRANGFFLQTGRLFEPAKKRFARGPGKGFSHHRLADARRLTDEQHPAQDSATGNRRRMHERTAPAVAQPRDVALEARVFFRSAGHLPNDGKEKGAG